MSVRQYSSTTSYDSNIAKQHAPILNGICQQHISDLHVSNLSANMIELFSAKVQEQITIDILPPCQTLLQYINNGDCNLSAMGTEHLPSVFLKSC